MSSAVIAQSHHRTGVILIAAAAVIWSTGGLLGRMVETEPGDQAVPAFAASPASRS